MTKEHSAATSEGLSRKQKIWHYLKYSAGERKLMNMIRALDRKMEKNMAAIDNLNTAVASVETAATAILAVVAAGNQDPAIQAAADKLTTVAASLNAAVPVPVPAPAP